MLDLHNTIRRELLMRWIMLVEFNGKYYPSYEAPGKVVLATEQQTGLFARLALPAGKPQS